MNPVENQNIADDVLDIIDVPSTIGDLKQGLIETYGPLLFDDSLVLAVLVTWGVTHFIKMSPPVQAIECGNGVRRWVIRAVAVVVGFLSVLFFKRDEPNFDAVLNLAVFVAFANTAIYLIVKSIIKKLSPKTAEILSSK